MSCVFSNSRPDSDNQESQLRVGYVKSNAGHSEPAAGISGILKTVLAVKRGIILGNLTFELPNPTINFSANKILPSKAVTCWPQNVLRRASVNLFGYGGLNSYRALVGARGGHYEHRISLQSSSISCIFFVISRYIL